MQIYASLRHRLWSPSPTDPLLCLRPIEKFQDRTHRIKPIIGLKKNSVSVARVFNTASQVVYEPLKKYLQCQGVVKPVMYIALLDNILSIFMNWLFIYQFNMGFLGAPLARGVCYRVIWRHYKL